MTEQGSGLRFDIYERVHLPEGLDGIEELEEAELVPHIQVVEEDDYAVIKGNLWLTGAYRGDSGLSGQTLEHLIPVEITMPQNRISRLEDVRVEIDQFDVELLTGRSLNVTGVLSLHGLEMLSYTERADEEGSEEETVFSYEIPVPDRAYAAVRSEEPAGKAEENENAGLVENAENEENEEPEGFAVDPAIQEWVVEEADNLQPLFVQPEAEKPKKAAPAAEDKTNSDNGGLFGNPVFTGESETENAENENPPGLWGAEAAENEAAEPADRQEVKVAISAKPNELSHLHALVRPEAPASTAENVKEPAVSASEAVEWKKLFIREKEVGAFKRMRICIVQKEETIEDIADRYKLSARELAFYNQLGGQPVGEGQVLVIPS
ncbi:LysM peptidoglycan-binding domain-containing protein [Gorillibacterium sp. sgz500922]|uniref:LysM peptidoglycan-binding domain-containing protein n=1 Tax=Gorillibacterium sp. sgz500922 TaxID=3446694 RepID=UPI003F67AEB6